MLIDEIAKEILAKTNKKKAAHHELLFSYFELRIASFFNRLHKTFF